MGGQGGRQGKMQALFLPAVWEDLKKPEIFLGHLKKKAGMAPDHWSPTFKAWRFITVEAYNRDLPDAGSVWR